jgi:hypothetical protein
MQRSAAPSPIVVLVFAAAINAACGGSDSETSGSGGAATATSGVGPTSSAGPSSGSGATASSSGGAGPGCAEACDAWQFQSWDADCTQGYTLARTCPAGSGCTTTDHAACNEALPGGAVPDGCPACTGCAPACQGKACGIDDGCGAACLEGSGCDAAAQGLRYFGYWRDTYFGGNWMAETQTHGNFTMIEDGSYDSLLPSAAGYGIGVLLTPPALGDWAAAQPTLSQYADRIIGYVLQDDADVQPDYNVAKANVEAYATTIHAAYPNAHLYINLAGHFRDIPDFALPAGVDWVGLECYSGVADCDDMVTKLTPKLPPGGRIWVMPPGETGYGDQAWLVSNAQAMYDWAVTKPVIIGMNVFVWQTEILIDATYMGQLATRDLPDLRLTACQVARTITGRGDPNACP